VADPEVLEPDTTTALERQQTRHPGIPITIGELAARKGEAVEIIDARITILETARKRAIRMTSPEDWILYKAKDERITGYLQDAGCDRIRDITGIEVFGVSAPERLVAADGQSFMYVITGNGRSKLTGQVVEHMEGGRSSTDDFCKDKTGQSLELTVRKAARANLDGNITRELAGLKSVPLDELKEAWKESTPPKNWEHCHKGRGFGSQDERLGATRVGEPEVDAPTCPHCKPVNGQPVKLKYRAGKDGREPFYGCPNYQTHPNAKVIINAAEWIAKQKAATPAVTTTTDREPGAEG
jgi:hypothetical protein